MNLPLRVVNAVKRRANRYSETPKALVKRAEYEARVLLGSITPRTGFNRILDDDARFEYAAALKEICALAPEVVANKIPRANIQQAFVFDAVRHFAKQYSAPRLLCVGSFDDSASASLKKVGFSIEEIDPVVNQLSLDAYCNLPTTKMASFDVVFSTSVLEHVEDDELFVRQMSELLVPGGVGVLTCDFKEGYAPGQPVIQGDYRFYTKADLLGRIKEQLVGCELVDTPRWDCSEPDFELAGYKYTFATLVFRKTS